MAKQKYLISNLVYGQPYTNLFLENHLKSMLDLTNIPAALDTYDIEYNIFTDEETFTGLGLKNHPNFIALSRICAVNIVKVAWPADSDHFGARYAILVKMFHESLARALQENAWLSVIVADLVYAKHAVPKILRRLADGHDGVFNVPIRSAADSVSPVLMNLPGAPSELELFELAYANLHHLWVASHWDAPLFSRMPYSMLWNSGTGLVAHSFGITPIAFKPTKEMTKVQGVIDADVPAFCKNPYWATNWTDAAVAGVEPLSNGHYPPFKQGRSNVQEIVKWSKVATMPEQANMLNHPLFYPSRSTFNDTGLAAEAQRIAEKMQTMIHEGPAR